MHEVIGSSPTIPTKVKETDVRLSLLLLRGLAVVGRPRRLAAADGRAGLPPPDGRAGLPPPNGRAGALRSTTFCIKTFEFLRGVWYNNAV